MEKDKFNTLYSALAGKLERIAKLLQPELGQGHICATGKFAAHPLARKLGFTDIDAAAMGLYPEEWLNPEWSSREIKPFVSLTASPDSYIGVNGLLSGYAERLTTDYNRIERIDDFEYKLANLDTTLTISISPNVNFYGDAGIIPEDANERALFLALEHFDGLVLRGVLPSYSEFTGESEGYTWPEALCDTSLPKLFPETRGRLIWVEQWVRGLSQVTGMELGVLEVLYRRLALKIMSEEDFTGMLASTGITLGDDMMAWLEPIWSLKRKCHFACPPPRPFPASDDKASMRAERILDMDAR